MTDPGKKYSSGIEDYLPSMTEQERRTLIKSYYVSAVQNPSKSETKKTGCTLQLRGRPKMF